MPTTCNVSSILQASAQAVPLVLPSLCRESITYMHHVHVHMLTITHILSVCLTPIFKTILSFPWRKAMKSLPPNHPVPSSALL